MRVKYFTASRMKPLRRDAIVCGARVPTLRRKGQPGWPISESEAMSEVIERATGIKAGALRSGRRFLTPKRLLGGALGGLLLAATAQTGVHHWRVGRFMVETDDAYVQADSVIIAPRISGI